MKRLLSGKPLIHIVCVSLLFSFRLYAQQFDYRGYTSEVGIDKGTSRAIVKDTTGFVLIGTDNGIYRYDGLKFENFKEGLPNPAVKGLIRTRNGKVIASTDAGVVEVQNTPKKLTFKTLIAPNKSKDTILVSPKLMYEDNIGNLYITDNYGVLKYKDGKIKKYRFSKEKITNSNYHSVSLCEDLLGVLAFAENGSCFRFDKSLDIFKEIELKNPLHNVTNVINLRGNTELVACREGLVVVTFDNLGREEGMSIIPNSVEIDASRLWKQDANTIYIGSWTSGLYRMQLQGGKYIIDKVDAYKLKNVNAFFTENGREIWLASDDGVANLTSYYFRKDLESFAPNEIRSVGESENGEIFFTDGDFIYKVSEHDGKFSADIIYQSLGTLILQIYPTSEGIWFSDSEGNLVLTNDGFVLKSYDLSQYGKGGFSMAIDKRNNVWLLQEEIPSAPEYQPGILRINSAGEIHHFGRKEGVNARLTCVKIGRDAHIYCGGSSQEKAFLLVFDDDKKRFMTLPIDKNLSPQNEKVFEINDIAQSTDGTLWLASTWGLLKYQQRKLEKLYTGKVNNPAVQSVEIDGKNQVWFADERGLVTYKPDGCVVFDDKTGLADKGIGYARLLIDGRSRLWVGTNKGLNFTPINQPLEKSTRPSLINIEYQGNEADIEKMNFGFGEFLKFIFISPSTNTINTNYEYRWAGKDTAWTKMQTNYLVVSNLEDGEHILEVRALRSGSYTYSKTLKIPFKIYRFWYQKPWLLFILGLVAILAAIGVFRLYFWRLQARSRELEVMVQDRTAEVVRQSQLLEERNQKLQQVNKELQIAKQKTEEAAQAKVQFLSSITHEIRTPLNGVIGITNALIENSPRPDQVENLNILEFSAKNLLSLVNDVLDFNKLDANKMELEMLPIELHGLLEKIIKTFQFIVKAKGIGLELKIDPNVPQQIVCDPLRLNQVLTNLLGNAIKFTQQGGVVLQVICDKKSDKDKKATLTFEVHDTGIGIPEDRVEKIFEGFTQASADISRRFGGTGLGLSISNKILKLLHSQLQVHSVYGSGSTFFFTVELDIPEEKAVVADAATQPVAKDALIGKKVLLCEDNEINVLIATNMLKKWQVQYEVAENGKQAVEWANKEKFDIILMDLNMPEMDGFEAVIIIRAMNDEHYKKVPIIAFSAASEGGRDEQAYQAGMNDFIIKPFKPDELYEKISKLL